MKVRGKMTIHEDTIFVSRYFNEVYDSLERARETRLIRTVRRGFRKFGVHDGGKT